MLLRGCIALPEGPPRAWRGERVEKPVEEGSGLRKALGYNCSLQPQPGHLGADAVLSPVEPEREEVGRWQGPRGAGGEAGPQGDSCARRTCREVE